jgi:polysaccharide deacetylase 2 family uncharacterized protein YibQ
MTPGTGRLLLARTCLIVATALSGSTLQAESANDAAAQPVIAIIIDDLGHQRIQGQRATNLDGPVACAILPHTSHAKLLATQAHSNGKEVLLHLPLQSMDPDQSADPGQITLDNTHTQFTALLQQNIDAIPYIQGINTHMGSLVTRHPGHMRWLMDAIASRGNLFFVDSFTTPSSVGFQLALEQGIPATRRHVFLDNVQESEAVAVQFNRLLTRARRDGYAVGIGHPYRVTMDYLERTIPLLDESGVKLVSIATIIQHQSDRLQKTDVNFSTRLSGH